MDPKCIRIEREFVKFDEVNIIIVAKDNIERKVRRKEREKIQNVFLGCFASGLEPKSFFWVRTYLRKSLRVVKNAIEPSAVREYSS